MATTFQLDDIRSVRDIVRRALRFAPPGSALDLGSGVGRHALFLAKRGFRVTAVDNRSETVAALRELSRLQGLGIRVVRTDAATYAPAQRFGTVLNLMLLHFLPPAAQRAILATTRDATLPGGIHVTSSFTSESPAGLRPHLLKPGELARSYEAAGWEILHSVERPSPTHLPGGVTDEAHPTWIAEVIARRPL